MVSEPRPDFSSEPESTVEEPLAYDDSEPWAPLTDPPLDEYDDLEWVHLQAGRLDHEQHYDTDDRPLWQVECGLPEGWQRQEAAALEAERRREQLCTQCAHRPRTNGPLCTDCWVASGRLCRVCQAKPKRAGDRCDTCRKYFARTGRDRPARLAARQPALNLRRPERPGELTSLT